MEQSVKFYHKETLCSHRVASLVTRSVANERVQQNGLPVSLCERESVCVRMDACLSAMVLSLWATVLWSKILIESQSGL